jgi:L-amino acid N-acyltransferase YncA
MTTVATTSECLIRTVAPADMAAVTGIYAHFVETSTATFDLVAPGEATMQRRRQTVIENGLPYLVAELEGYVVGYCYASPFAHGRAIGSQWKIPSTSVPTALATASASCC